MLAASFSFCGRAGCCSTLCGIFNRVGERFLYIKERAGDPPDGQARVAAAIATDMRRKVGGRVDTAGFVILLIHE